MKKQTPVITDEHIVAYLDGELEAGEDFRSELRANPELANATKEYAVLKKVFASSRADSRFMLSARLDEKTRQVLADALATVRSTVRKAAPMPSRAASHIMPAIRSVKYLWAKRIGMGFALAGLAVSLWFNFSSKNEQITQVPVPQNNHIVAPPETVAPRVIQTQVPTTEQYATKTGHTGIVSSATRTRPASVAPKNIAANSISQTEAPPVQTRKETKEDPADIMISRRYAKMIKATPVVDVTEQDRVNEQM